MKKKILAGISAALMMISSLGVTASATAIYGDVDNSGSVGLSDVIVLNRFLMGKIPSSSINMKYSDVDKNMVIDVNDSKTLTQYVAHVISALPYHESTTAFNYSASDYVIPADSTRSYKKKDCATGAVTDYTLSAASPIATLAGDYDDRVPDSDDNAQAVVKITNSTGSDIGSGFIVGNHIIATAAHCVYQNTNGIYRPNLAVKVYNTAGTSPVATCTIKEIHTPAAYLSYGGSSDYDYALIYVEEDLSAYGKISLGVPTNKFSSTSQQVKISGFPNSLTSPSHVSNRYCAAGNISVIPSDSPYNSAYVLKCTTYASSGDSGGPLYIEYTLRGEVFRSAIGIFMSGGDSTRYATRVTLPVLRFFNSNPNVGTTSGS